MRTHARRSLVLLWFCACGLGACGARTPPPQPPAPPAPPPARLRAFSEPTAVTSVAASDRWLFAGTAQGLLRWDLRSKTYTWVGTDDGLPARAIEAMATTTSGALWVATPAGVGRGVEGAWTVTPGAPVGTAAVLLPDGETTLWVGGSEGLARVHGGRFERFLAGVPVTALALDGKKGLWIGTGERGLLHLATVRRGQATVASYGAPEGCGLARVQALFAEEEALYAVGESEGVTMLALYERGRCWMYAAKESLEPLMLARGARGLQLFGRRGAWVLERLAPSATPRAPVRLNLVAIAAIGKLAQTTVRPDVIKPVPAPSPPAHRPDGKAPPAHRPAPAKAAAAPAAPAAAPAAPAPPRPPPTPLPPVAAPARKPLTAIPPDTPHFEAHAAGIEFPPEVTTILVRADEVWLGTRRLGVARAGKLGLAYLRTHELTEGAERLTVACQAPRECYVATGGTQAWRFDGERFTPAAIDPEPGARVLAIVRDARSRVVAIHRGASGRALRLSRLIAEAWMPVAIQELEVPSNVPEITFAVFAPTGKLWIGLHYRDPDGEDRPYGAAEVDLDAAGVTYHRTYPSGVTPPPESLPIPNDVTAVLFRPDAIWFATKSGACRVKGREVELFTENQGLESELLRDIEEGPDGEIWVASLKGVGRFDGKRWRFERSGPLGAKIRAIARGEHGWTWLGTDRGLVLVAGPTIELYDTSRGLLEQSVVDLAIDSTWRVWALSPRGVTIVER